jgi:penicillin amidase
VADPEVGRIWTANARVVSDEFYKIVGDSNYDRGARQMQIRDGLLALEKATEADMLKIQLDDRALFLGGWRNLLLEVLDEAAVEGNEQRAQLRTLVENWGGRAAPGSVGYRAVWQFRNMILGPLSDLICQPCKKHIPKYTLAEFHRTEGPLWKIVTQRPDHFLDPRFESWQAFLLAGADRVIEDASKNGGRLEGYTWGALNTFKIQHPLSMAIPALSQWLDMPVQEIAGSRADMPRIQGPNFGASQRMAVSPGKELEGYMHIPCGQSGHPLSPHYSDSHADWVEGRPRAFLPGKTINTLTLKPK